MRFLKERYNDLALRVIDLRFGKMRTSEIGNRSYIQRDLKEFSKNNNTKKAS